MLLISLAVCAFVPFSTAFSPPFSTENYYQASLLGINALFLVDVILNLMSATYDSLTGEEIN